MGLPIIGRSRAEPAALERAICIFVSSQFVALVATGGREVQ
jgi:hypothetical protein